MKINLNADMGESFGAWSMGRDNALLQVVNSANVACGFHAGDPSVMLDTVAFAVKAGVSIGAHPSFPDLQGFGRRPMTIAPRDLAAAVIYQIGALQGVAAASGGTVTHVKPHGAMNNMACTDIAMARVIAGAVKSMDPNLILVAPALSQLAMAGEEAGLAVALEIFADRAYAEDGTLAPRSQPGAVLHEPAECLEHVLRMVEAGGLVTRSGKLLATHFHSICVHGDNDQAVAAACAIRDGLISRGHQLQPLPQLLAAS